MGFALVAILAGAVGCGSTDSPPPAGSGSTRTTAVPPTSSATAHPTNTTNEESTVTSIRITVDGRTLTARLADNATTRDLLDQLPLTLRFRDFNHVEKIAKLPRPLTLDGAPAGADPDVDDIGYYAPSGDLVLYYGDVGYFTGIVRVGHFSSDLDVVRDQPDGFRATLRRAG